VRAALVALVVLAIGIGAPAAAGAPGLMIGISDDAMVVHGNPDETFPLLDRLRTQVLRVTVRWDQVASVRPTQPANHADFAYDWRPYDRAAFYAQQFGIRLVFTIYGTPGWANGDRGPTYAPRKMTDLRAFALAAGRRYSGIAEEAPGGRILPRVDLWTAWNEPNAPTFLKPQFVKAGSRYRLQSAITYARMCNAIVKGIHAAGNEVRPKVKETVACGVTNPRGNNIGRGARASASPLVFLRGMHAAGARFDVYAHHPYAGSRLEGPATRTSSATAVTLGNIDRLLAELTRLYGADMRLWITEYGYQTNPPDRLFGVTWKRQADYLRQAFALARANPRIDMMIWFLLRDEPGTSGWQSGFFTTEGRRKPAFAAFRNLPR
jgi:hypothetical protein